MNWAISACGEEARDGRRWKETRGGQENEGTETSGDRQQNQSECIHGVLREYVPEMRQRRLMTMARAQGESDLVAARQRQVVAATCSPESNRTSI